MGPEWQERAKVAAVIAGGSIPLVLAVEGVSLTARRRRDDSRRSIETATDTIRAWVMPQAAQTNGPVTTTGLTVNDGQVNPATPTVAIRNTDADVPMHDVRVVVAVPGIQPEDTRYFEAHVPEVGPGKTHRTRATTEVLRPQNTALSYYREDRSSLPQLSGPTVVERSHRDPASGRTYRLSAYGSGRAPGLEINSGKTRRHHRGDPGLGRSL